ncbi:MAG: hypothetical protein JXR73_07080 [Candidatus Omnitrophica bacterium]|nr:hypothetical protein [Candidatus Omnitrophota bacterium]
MLKLSTIFILSSMSAIHLFGDTQTEKGQPSAASLFSATYDISDATSGVNRVISEKLLGFPFDLTGIDQKTQQLIQGVHSDSLHGVQDEILDLYWSGSLSEGKLSETMKNTIANNFSLIRKLPLEGTMNLAAFMTQEPQSDIKKLLAAFMICGIVGMIPDIIPFLECSNVCVGDAFLALGYRPFISGSSQIEQDPGKPLPPEQRLTFWPASNAILKNPDISLPLLIETVKRTDIRTDIRLRAASFINTLEPDLINDGFIQSCDQELQKQLAAIRENGIKWRHSLKFTDEEFIKKHNAILRKHLNLPPEVDMKQIRKEMDEHEWGKY